MRTTCPTIGALSVGILSTIISVCLPPPLVSQEYQREVDRIAEEVSETVTKANLKSVAVLDFTDLQGNVQELGRFMAEELTTSLVLKDRPFKTIDRANLRSILTESKLSMTGLINPEDTKKLKISGVDGLVRGTLTPFGESIRLTIQVIAVETAQIVGAARGVVPKTNAMDSLGGAIEPPVSQTGGTDSSVGSPSAKGQFVFQGSTLKVTLQYFRKDSGGSIKAVFVIENVTKNVLYVYWSEPQLIDNQGEQWRLAERSGIQDRSYGDAVAPGAFLTALLVFKQDKEMGKATRFNLIGPISIYDGNQNWNVSPNFQNIGLGI